MSLADLIAAVDAAQVRLMAAEREHSAATRDLAAARLIVARALGLSQSSRPAVRRPARVGVSARVLAAMSPDEGRTAAQIAAATGFDVDTVHATFQGQLKTGKVKRVALGRYALSVAS